MEYIEIGKIVNTHGIKGEMKIKSFTDFERFKKGSKIYVGSNKEPLIIVSNRQDKGFEYVCFKDMPDINMVLKYKGLLVYILSSEREELAEDEFYYDELIGLDVYNEAGIKRGVVTGVRELPQGELLEVMGEKKAFIPFRKEFIIEVSDKIVIHEIEGLL